MNECFPTPRPEGADLLITAADVFSARLLPTLPEDQRHLGLMVAKALGIAAREWRPGPPDPGTGRASAALAAAIRAGSLDIGPEAQSAWALLHQQAVECLRVDNPPAAERYHDFR